MNEEMKLLNSSMYNKTSKFDDDEIFFKLAVLRELDSEKFNATVNSLFKEMKFTLFPVVIEENTSLKPSETTLLDVRSKSDESSKLVSKKTKMDQQTYGRTKKKISQIDLGNV